MNQKIRAIGAAVLVAIWVALTGFMWFGPRQESSTAERRPLEQFPGISGETILNGSFMKDFEKFTLDQFPLRDSFRQIKALFHNYGLWQMDNNDIYISNGYAAKMEYPLNESSVKFALAKFQGIYDRYLKDTGAKTYMAIVPDKGYYLAESSGHLRMNYEKLFAMVQSGTPWATFVDLRDTLSLEDYYRTDTHWRQECILPAAGKLSEAMGVTPPKATDFNATKVDKDFYGVYYGQAALPMKPESIWLLRSPVTEACRVQDVLKGRMGKVYDMTKLNSKDLYDLYLSGPVAMLSIENPTCTTGRELVIFRDSFGSSIIPLLLQDYSRVTVVDIRYTTTDEAMKRIPIKDQDVLFLYSTLVLNSATVLQ